MANPETGYSEGPKKTNAQSTPEQLKIENDRFKQGQLTPEQKAKEAQVTQRQAEEVDNLLELAENGGVTKTTEQKESAETQDPIKEYKELTTNIDTYLKLIDSSYPNTAKYEKDHTITVGKYRINLSGHGNMGGNSISIQKAGSNDIYNMGIVVVPNAVPHFAINKKSIDVNDKESMEDISTIMQSVNRILQKEITAKIEAKTVFQTLDSAGLSDMVTSNGYKDQIKSLKFTSESIGLLQKAKNLGFTLESTFSRTNSFWIKNASGATQGEVVYFGQNNIEVSNNTINILNNALNSQNLIPGLQYMMNGKFDTDSKALIEQDEKTFSHIHDNRNNTSIISDEMVAKFKVVLAHYMVEKGFLNQDPTTLSIRTTIGINGEKVFQVTGKNMNEPININFGP